MEEVNGGCNGSGETGLFAAAGTGQIASQRHLSSCLTWSARIVSKMVKVRARVTEESGQKNEESGQMDEDFGQFPDWWGQGPPQEGSDTGPGILFFLWFLLAAPPPTYRFRLPPLSGADCSYSSSARIFTRGRNARNHPS